MRGNVPQSPSELAEVVVVVVVVVFRRELHKEEREGGLARADAWAHAALSTKVFRAWASYTSWRRAVCHHAAVILHKAFHALVQGFSRIRAERIQRERVEELQGSRLAAVESRAVEKEGVALEALE